MSIHIQTAVSAFQNGNASTISTATYSQKFSSDRCTKVFQRTLSSDSMQSRKRKPSSSSSDPALQNPERALKQRRISSIPSISVSSEKKARILESRMLACTQRAFSKQQLDIAIALCCKTYAEIIETMPTKVSSSTQVLLSKINRHWSKLIERRKQAFFTEDPHLPQPPSDEDSLRKIAEKTTLSLSIIEKLSDPTARVTRRTLEILKERFQFFLKESSAQILNMKTDNCLKACDQFDKYHNRIKQMVEEINNVLINFPNQQFFEFKPAPHQSLQPRSHRST